MKLWMQSSLASAALLLLQWCARVAPFTVTHIVQVGQFNRFGGFVVITWCIVAMQGFYFDSTSMLLLQAGVRVIGIIVGVLIGLAGSILILPDSAFGQVRAHGMGIQLTDNTGQIKPRFM